MTRKEAVTVLRNAAWLGSDADRERTEEAVEMAIEALSNDKQTVKLQDSNDTISRQAAIDELWRALHEYEDETEKKFRESDELDVGDWIVHRGFVQNMSDIDRQTIQNLPPAQPERKTGKWIPHKEISREYIGTVLISVIYDYWSCGACGYRVENGRPTYKFCPNCGAKMEENDETDRRG